MARDYKKEYAQYQGTPEQIHKRAQRNAARRELMKEGVVHKGDGKDVDHKHPIDKGGSNARSNLRVMSVKKNRGYRRDSRNQPL
jgi:5-methylcytosine-specific restriction endonuclease McrA